MKLSKDIVKRLRTKSGLTLTSSYDCKFLVQSIGAETGKQIGLSTMKRLLGFFPDDRKPRRYTLDILANYLDYTSWEELIGENASQFSGFEVGDKCLHACDIEKGERIQFGYLPNRFVTLQYLGEEHFTVLSAENSKLCCGDVLTIHTMVAGFPLFVKEVVRDGKSLGSYIAAREGGIKNLTLQDIDGGI